MTSVLLRPFDPADDPALVALFADPETRQWNPTTLLDPAGWRRRNDVRSPGVETWAVADAGDGRLLGTVALTDIDTRQGTAELGYRTVPAERGRGAGRAGLLLASRRAHEVLGLRRLQLFHAIENEASCRVAEAVGYRWEGTLRASYVYGDGRPHDEHLHGRLAGDALGEVDPAS